MQQQQRPSSSTASAQQNTWLSRRQQQLCTQSGGSSIGATERGRENWQQRGRQPASQRSQGRRLAAARSAWRACLPPALLLLLLAALARPAIAGYWGSPDGSPDNCKTDCAVQWLYCGNTTGNGRLPTNGGAINALVGPMLDHGGTWVKLNHTFNWYGTNIQNRFCFNSNYGVQFGGCDAAAQHCNYVPYSTSGIYFDQADRSMTVYGENVMIPAINLFYTRFMLFGRCNPNSVGTAAAKDNSNNACDHQIEMYFARDGLNQKQYIGFNFLKWSACASNYGPPNICIKNGQTKLQLYWPDGDSNPRTTFAQGQSWALCSDLTGSSWTSVNGYYILPMPPPSPPPPAPPSPSPPPPRPPPSPPPSPPPPPPSPPPSPPPRPPPPSPPPSPPPRPPPGPPPNTWNYTSAMTNYSYLLNTQRMDQLTAHQTCQAEGGFLVTYFDAREQVGSRWVLAAG
jgi:hypothetical protein